jgi:hypothetical protein
MRTPATAHAAIAADKDQGPFGEQPCPRITSKCWKAALSSKTLLAEEITRVSVETWADRPIQWTY